MNQYLRLCSRVMVDGVWVTNERTGKSCKTIINADLIYNMRNHKLPLITTRDVPWKLAIAEFLGYLKGCDNAADFRKLGCPTWDANANDNEQWLANPYRKGHDDMGRVYGVQGRRWVTPEWDVIDQLDNVYQELLNGSDNRGLIMHFWNVGELDRGCLRPCVWAHTFSLLDGELHLTSYQRSDDLPLGHVFNQVQLGMFLMLMAQITGHKPGCVYHKVVNAHIYEDQMELMHRY